MSMSKTVRYLRGYANRLVRKYKWREEHPLLARVRRNRRRGPNRTPGPTTSGTYYRDWARAHRDERRESCRRWRESHMDFERERQKAYYWANRERRLAYNAEWHKKNRVRVSLRQVTRLHNARSNGGSHTTQEWLKKCGLFAFCCAYCGEKKPLQRDHKIPVSRGGTNDIANILPACKSCNAKKKHRTTAEFLAGMPIGRAA